MVSTEIIAIPVGIVVGLGLLACIGGALSTRCCRRSADPGAPGFDMKPQEAVTAMEDGGSGGHTTKGGKRSIAVSWTTFVRIVP